MFPQTFPGDMFPPRKCCVKVAKLTGPLEFPKKKYFSRKVGRYVLEVISDSEPEEVEMDLGKKSVETSRSGVARSEEELM